MADKPDPRPTGAAPGSGVIGSGDLGRGISSAALLPQVARRLLREMDRRFAEMGLTAQQAGLLVRAAVEPTSPSRLTELLGTDAAGMTRLLDTLERKGLVRRGQHPSDRRAVMIELTPAGHALAPRLRPIIAKVTAQMFAGFTAAEISRIDDALGRMLRNLDVRPPRRPRSSR